MSRIESLAGLVGVGLLIVGGILWIVWAGGISFETRNIYQQADDRAKLWLGRYKAHEKRLETQKTESGGQPTPAGTP